MKRKIEYITEDNMVFTSRTQAHMHEINLTRRNRITAFFLSRLGQTPEAQTPVQISAIVDTVIAHATDFAEVLSARATKRAIKSPKAPTQKTTQRRRYSKQAAAAPRQLAS